MALMSVVAKKKKEIKKPINNSFKVHKLFTNFKKKLTQLIIYFFK